MALATNTLQTIRDMIRQLVLSPSPNQLPDATIDQWINTFVAYDFPEMVRVWDLHSTLTFWVSPNIDTYPLDGLPSTDPLYNFKNLYTTIEQPLYIAGYQSLYTQQPQQLYSQYPQTRTIASIGTTGNGTTTTFSGNINQASSPGTGPVPSVRTPILQSTVTIPVLGTGEPNQYNWGMVLFSSVDTYNNVLNMVDAPVPGPFAALPYNWVPPVTWGLGVIQSTPTGLTSNGNWGILFNPLLGPSSWDGVSFINYITGQFVVVFSNPSNVPTAPASGATINSTTYPYVASRPQMMMYYDDKFVFRPVPDQAYAVSFEVYKRPTQLIAYNQVPDIEQWFQFIAYGAAIKIMQFRRDVEGLQLHMEEFKKQEALVLRKTIVQITTQRTSTIYVQSNGMFGYGNGWSYNGF